MSKLSTPWGPADYVHYHGEDRQVLRVGTSSHGGIGVLPSLSMPAYLAALADTDGYGTRWYEEDIAWAIAVTAFPDRFERTWVEAAKDTMRNEFPEAYVAHYGGVLTAETSRILERRQFEAATRNNFVVTASFGEWAWNCPTGFVYACGWRRSDEATAGFLVPAEKYVNPGRLVLDEFPRWEPDRSLPYFKPKAETPRAATAA